MQDLIVKHVTTDFGFRPQGQRQLQDLVIRTTEGRMVQMGLFFTAGEGRRRRDGGVEDLRDEGIS
jgi:hypothetical protein